MRKGGAESDQGNGVVSYGATKLPPRKEQGDLSKISRKEDQASPGVR